jgi:hypothetical protein
MKHFKKTAEQQEKEFKDACEFAIKQTTDIQALFAGDKGDLGLKALDGLTGYEHDPFDPDPYKHAFKAGKRAVSVVLRDMLNRDVKEAKKEMEKKNE